jgi:sulfatase modifying factor 1
MFGARQKFRPVTHQKLQGMYYQGDDRVFDRNEIDVRLLKYNFSSW